MGCISEFLENYSKKNTITAYRSAIKKFLEFIYCEELKNEEKCRCDLGFYEGLAERYFNENRDYGKDLVNFAVYLAKEGIPPKSASTYISAVKEWLSWNEIELSEKIIKEVRRKMPKGGVRTASEILDKEKLRKILNSCDIKGKALFMVLASTGMRIGEALSIELDDLRLDSDPPEIIVRGERTKTGEMRVVFLTQEAKGVLQQWLEVRKKYLHESFERTRNFRSIGKTPINLEDKRVFPFSVPTAEKMWEKALEKAGLLEKDKSTGRKTLTIHSLRKFFRTQLVKARIPQEVIDALMGHNRKSLQQIYTRIPKDEVIGMWKQAELELSIFASEAIENLRKELQNKEEELKRKEKEIEEKFKELRSELEMQIKQESIIHKATVESLVKDKIELELRIQKLEKEIERLKEFIIALVKGKVGSIPFAKTDDDVFEMIRNEAEDFVESS